jgi:hypothetical protein
MVSGDRGGGSGVLGAAERAQRKVAEEGGNGCCWVVFNRMGGRKGGLGERSRKGEGGGPVGDTGPSAVAPGSMAGSHTWGGVQYRELECGPALGEKRVVEWAQPN